MTAARRGSDIVTRLQRLSAFDLGNSGLPRFPPARTVTSTTFQAARTLDLLYSFAMARYTKM
jgi:hypothetical protein